MNVLTLQQEIICRYLANREIATFDEAKQYVLEQSSNILNTMQKSIKDFDKLCHFDDAADDYVFSDAYYVLEKQIAEIYRSTRRSSLANLI